MIELAITVGIVRVLVRLQRLKQQLLDAFLPATGKDRRPAGANRLEQPLARSGQREEEEVPHGHRNTIQAAA